MTARHFFGAAVVIAFLVIGCGSEDPPADSANTEAPNVLDFPTVVDATATAVGDSWRFDVTISSPYDSPTQYADAWRVLGPDGTEYGIRVLTHDHAGEQPFTRSLSGVVIPDDVSTVVIGARDLLNGWSEDTYELVLP